METRTNYSMYNATSVYSTMEINSSVADINSSITGINSSIAEINSSIADINSSITDEAQSTNPMSSFQENAIYKLSMILLYWSLPIIICIGTVGNIFSFIVMLQREMRQTSTFFYLMILAATDTAVLFVSAFKTLIRIWCNFEMLHISAASCKTLTFLTYLSLQMSAWLIVAVTVERFIVVWFPLKAPSICSTKRAKITTLGIVLVLVMLNAHLFWTADLIISDNGRRQCGMLQNNKFLYHEVIPWIHLTLYSFLPFVSLLIFNILIIVSLVKHRQIIKSQMTRDDRRTRYNHRKLAVTLLSVSFIWIFTATPSALFTVLPIPDSTLQQKAIKFLVKVICFILMYINHSINFFLYCITGQTFRREFVKFICRTCRKRQKPKPKLTFRASRSGSKQETTFPLMENKYARGNKVNLNPDILTFMIEAPDDNLVNHVIGRLQIIF